MMPSKNQSLTGSNANENKFITQKKMNRREALRRAIDAETEKVASDKIDWKESQMLQAAIAASAAEDKNKVEMLATEKAVLLESSPRLKGDWLERQLRQLKKHYAPAATSAALVIQHLWKLKV